MLIFEHILQYQSKYIENTIEKAYLMSGGKRLRVKISFVKSDQKSSYFIYKTHEIFILFT